MRYTVATFGLVTLSNAIALGAYYGPDVYSVVLTAVGAALAVGPFAD